MISSKNLFILFKIKLLRLHAVSLKDCFQVKKSGFSKTMNRHQRQNHDLEKPKRDKTS